MNDAAPRTRLVVLTDISTLTANHGEPDDTQSMVRLLHYANDLEIEALIASRTGHGGLAHPEYIEHLVAQYAQVRDSLALHDPRYPTADALASIVRGGHADADVVGPGLDSPGSDLLLEVLDKPDPRPVWITIWGGPHELAQALWRAERERTPSEFAALKRKIRIYSIGDQDATGLWIKERHPDLMNLTPYQTYRGVYRDGDPALVGPDWVEANVRNRHGALGAAYPNYHGGDPWGRVRGVKEGDTPSFLYLIPNGLGDPEQPGWESWGGRFASVGAFYTDIGMPADTARLKTVDERRKAGDPRCRAGVYQWRDAYQADFCARLDWCVMGPDEANHAPRVTVEGPLRRRVRPGEEVLLDASGTMDPDGDELAFRWEYRPDPSTVAAAPEIASPDQPVTHLIAPWVEAPATAHILLTVRDDGDPPLRAYRRVVLDIDPLL